MKRIIEKAAKAILTGITGILMPVIFIISFLFHFPYYLLKNKNS